MEGLGFSICLKAWGINLHLFDCWSKLFTWADVTTGGILSVTPRGLEQRELVLAMLLKQNNHKNIISNFKQKKNSEKTIILVTSCNYNFEKKRDILPKIRVVKNKLIIYIKFR